MKKQHKPKALDGLDRHSSAGHGVHRLLQEILREGTESRPPRSWHGGILSLRAFWGVHLPLPKVCRIRDVICETDHLASIVVRLLDARNRPDDNLRSPLGMQRYVSAARTMPNDSETQMKR